MTKYTAYTGEQLFKYLDRLKNSVKGIITDENTLQNLAHKQLYDILEAEEKYLRNHRQKQQDLAFTLHGLPSKDSLTADLETMCKLDGFEQIAENYQQDPKKKEPAYKPTTEKEWQEQKEKHKDTITKTHFTIQETKDRKLQLTLTEETYINRPDEHSQKHPLLIRHGTTTYRTQWDELLHQTEEKYLAADRTQAALTVIGNQSLIPYNNLEKEVKELGKISERYQKLMIYNDSFPKDSLKILEVLTDAAILGEEDTKTYTSAIKKINQALNPSFRTLENWKEYYPFPVKAGLLSAGGGVGACICTGIMVGGPTGGVIGLFGSVASVVLGIVTGGIIHSQATAATYKKDLTKHIQKHGQTLNKDIDTALDTAKKLHKQLENPQQLNAKYQDKLTEIAELKRQSEEDIILAILTLEELKEKK